MRAAGWALVVHERVEAVDVIVLASNTDFAGMLEAADLVHFGVASRVAVFADPPDTVDLEFIHRGIPYEDAAARSVRELRALGVDTIEQIPRKAPGTEDIGLVLPDWCDQQGFRSVVVVSTSDHSRRLRRVLHRSMKGPPDESHGSLRALLGIRSRSTRVYLRRFGNIPVLTNELATGRLAGPIQMSQQTQGEAATQTPTKRTTKVHRGEKT